MDAKLTLKLNKETIQQAKKYAKSKNISLSRLIENQLNAIIEERTGSAEIFAPEVSNLIGVIKKEED
jgi:hypothetical protein